MGLILPQEIETEVTNQTKYYEGLGYEIPKYYNKRKNGYFTKNGTKIKVSVEDLKTNSNLFVKVKCDKCGEIEEVTYMEYNRLKTFIKKYNYDYLCLDCKFDVLPTAKLNVGTFKNDNAKIKKFLIRKLTNFIKENGYPT